MGFARGDRRSGERFYREKGIQRRWLRRGLFRLRGFRREVFWGLRWRRMEYPRFQNQHLGGRLETVGEGQRLEAREKGVRKEEGVS